MEENRNMEFPLDLHYHSSNHMWAKKNDNGEVTVGIDALALDSLGDIAYVSFKEVGTTVKIGEAFGSLESAKMTTEIFSPVSGVITSLNDSVETNPHLINEQPYEGGWFVNITPSDWESDSANLVSGEAIKEWSVAEVNRYEKENMFD